MYQIILDKSYDTLTMFEEFRKLYPLKDTENFQNGKYCANKHCAWCGQCKREKFDEADLESVCCLNCHYCVNMTLKLPNVTGFEFEFIGKQFYEIKELNKYIITTASANYPDDPTFQEMFLMFYTTNELAISLLKYINTLDLDYDYVYYNKKANFCTQRINLMDIMRSWNEGEIWSPDTHLCDYFGDYGPKLNTFIEKELVFIYMIDNCKTRRTLNSVLLGFFESQHK